MKENSKSEECKNEESPAQSAKCAVDTPSAAEIDAVEMGAEEQALTIAELEAKIGEANAAAEKNKDLYIRAVADLDNYRRKAQREKQELAKFALQPFVEELLPSLDHLDMAIAASKDSKECENLIVGVEMVRSQISKILSSYGVEEISAKEKTFDPKIEDCVSHEPSDTVPENDIIRVTRKGYMYNGRLLRPAGVVVSSGKPKKD